MENRYFESIKEEISLLGFGCMRLPRICEEKQEIDEKRALEMFDYAHEHGVNYFDTAYPYHEGLSEPFVGKALKRYPRESFHLASKMPPWMLKSESDVERIFEDQLKRCQVDYFDFYLVHNICREHLEIVEKFHVYEFLKKKKEEGKIRRLGFSFHDKPALLRQVTDRYEWDFAQIQLNYLDWELQDAKTQYEILKSHQIPVVVMEPVRGGSLAGLSEPAAEVLKKENPELSTASWAVRFAASLPGVMTVLSGMSDLAQVQDNVKTMTDFKPLTQREREVLTEALDIYRSSGTIPCTGCRYCMDCPDGVDIPKVFAIYNQYRIDHNENSFRSTYGYLEEEKQAQHCVRCGKCMEHCPQHIQIPDKMEEIRDFAAGGN